MMLKEDPPSVVGGKAWHDILSPIVVLQTIDDMTDPKILEFNFGTKNMPRGKYKHTSISHFRRNPTWEEIKEVKEKLHGDTFVFHVLPPKAVYVNLHSHCFHLWEFCG